MAEQEDELAMSHDALLCKELSGGPSVDEFEAAWLEIAESGELDIYTCLGLCNMFTSTPEARYLLGQVSAVIVIQAVVPCLMLSMEATEGMIFHPSNDEKCFRITGAILFVYSVWTMYDGAMDECRTLFLDFALEHNMSAGYWIPPLLGEVLNTFVSMGLVLTLYVLFCKTEKVENLVLNAVALNFIGFIDSEFTTPDMKKNGIKHFKTLLPEYRRIGANSGVLSMVVSGLLHAARIVLTLFAGHLAAGVFCFYNDPLLCASLSMAPVVEAFLCEA